jgi:hypothetical protein
MSSDVFLYSHADCHYADCHYADCYADRHYAECQHAECHYAECHYAECRGAVLITIKSLFRIKDLCRELSHSLSSLDQFIATEKSF